MASERPIGSVTSLWRFPVKSMRGERLEEVTVEAHGIVGDRAYALIERESGKVVTGKSVRKFPDIMRCAGEFLGEPRRGQAPPPVRITLPDGRSVTSDSGDADRVLSEHWGVEVTLARTAPEEYMIDQYHPDVEDVDPRGNRDALVEQKLGSSLFEALGMPGTVPVGSLFDAYPMSLITTSTLERLRELRPESDFDERRFRMNALVASEGRGFVENGWVGREVSIGGEVRLRVAMPDPRCVMTTLEQEGLAKDPDVIRTLVRHNRLGIGDMGRFPCAGVYAEVAAGGMVRVGDGVVVV